MTNKKLISNILDSLGGTQLNVKVREPRPVSIESDVITRNVRKAEESFKARIPDEFINFCRDTGAISFNKPVYVKGMENIPVADKKNRVHVDNFFDFYDDEASILRALDGLKGNIPDHALPVCEGEAGDLIVIDMGSRNYGKVYYWHHEHEADNEGLYLIASNFQEFTNRLFNSIESTVFDDSLKKQAKVSRVSDKFLQRLKKSGKV